MAELPYQVVFLSGILVGASLDVLRGFGWEIEKPEHEGFEVVTPSKMRLRVYVEEVAE
jgi:hypothetical protein